MPARPLRTPHAFAVIALPTAGAAIGAAISATPWGALLGAFGGSAIALLSLARAGRGTPSPVAPAATAGTDLARSTGDFAGVIAALPHAALMTDAAGTILAANPAADDLLRGPLLGRHIEAVVTQADLLRIHAEAQQGRRAEASLRIAGEGPHRRYRALAAPVAGGAMVTLADDAAGEDAVRGQIDFVANASHEFRTPLASIRAASETLADGAWEDAAVRGRLTGIIAANTARLEAMIRGMLDLSRLEHDAPLTLGSANASDIAAGLRDLFEPGAKAREVTLAFDLDPRLDRLHTDPPLLTLILKNLVENAIKFADPGTVVRVEGTASTAGTGRGTATFRVIDRGIGIPLHAQARIFERFFQVDPSRDGRVGQRGTGLGLSIVHNAVKRLGGSINVESVWKQGTTMTVELPGAVEA